MLFTLRPLILENQGLVAALNQLAEKMQDMHNLKVQVEAQAGPEKWLDHHQQGVLFYIVEEAINNARKHAQGEHIWVRFYQKSGHIITEIEDDGVGFDTGDIEAGRKRNSLGMVNLRERTEMLGGMLDIQSQLGKGTKISVMVQVKENQRPASLDLPSDSAAPTPRGLPAAPAPLPETPPRPSQLKRLAAAGGALNPKSDIPHAKRLSPSD
jgi:nitrate/nitrite-specific signal transduction histidine kinase